MESKPSPNQLVQYGTKCKFNSIFCKHMNVTFACCTVVLYLMPVFGSTIQNVHRSETKQHMRQGTI